MDYAKESLRLHGQWKGKIEIRAAVPVETKEDLSLAYTPGVAAPCLEIQKDINKSYEEDPRNDSGSHHGYEPGLHGLRRRGQDL